MEDRQANRRLMEGDHLWTIQENRIIGSSEGARLEIANGRYWTPGVLLDSDDKSIEELNRRRIEARSFAPPFYILTMLDRVDEDNIELSFEPLNEKGETVRDPQILIVDKATGDGKASIDLTEKFYAGLRKYELKEMQRNSEKPRDLYQFFLRESPTKIEKETPEPSEGMRNV
ncbi:hypothetical protein BH09PAT1_BH09PAT1_1760 [soil metagenome]